jgi:hypothetical protein
MVSTVGYGIPQLCMRLQYATGGAAMEIRSCYGSSDLLWNSIAVVSASAGLLPDVLPDLS